MKMGDFLHPNPLRLGIKKCALSAWQVLITCALTKHYVQFAAWLLVRCNAIRNACAIQVKLNMLNLVFIFYKTAPPRHGVLEKTGGKKYSKCRVFSSFLFPFFSSFQGRLTCVLHHFAFLVCLPTHYFLRPITHFQPLKLHFLTAVLPFRAMFLWL